VCVLCIQKCMQSTPYVQDTDWTYLVYAYLCICTLCRLSCALLCTVYLHCVSLPRRVFTVCISAVGEPAGRLAEQVQQEVQGLLQEALSVAREGWRLPATSTSFTAWGRSSKGHTCTVLYWTSACHALVCLAALMQRTRPEGGLLKGWLDSSLSSRPSRLQYPLSLTLAHMGGPCCCVTAEDEAVEGELLKGWLDKVDCTEGTAAVPPKSGPAAPGEAHPGAAEPL